MRHLKLSTLILLGIFLFISVRAVAQEEIKIALLIPLTGPFAPAGKEIQNAAELAVKEINELKEIKSTIRLVIGDQGGDQRQTIEKARNLIDQEKVLAIIGPLGHDATRAVAENFAHSKILQFAFSLWRFPTTERPKLFFRVAPSYDKMIFRNGSFLIEELKAKRIGVIVSTSFLGREAQRVFQEQLNTFNLKPVISEQFPAKPDFLKVVQAAKVQSVDGIFFSGSEEDLKSFALATTREKLRWPIVAIANRGFGFIAAEELAKANIAPLIYFTGYPDIRKTNFFAFHLRTLGFSPKIEESVSAYSSLMIIKDAVLKAGLSASSGQLAMVVTKETFQTPLGKITFDGNGNAVFNLAIWQVQGDKITIAGTGSTSCPCKYRTCCLKEPDCKNKC